MLIGDNDTIAADRMILPWFQHNGVTEMSPTRAKPHATTSPLGRSIERFGRPRRSCRPVAVATASRRRERVAPRADLDCPTTSGASFSA